MNFSKALKMAKEGKAIRRSSWPLTENFVTVREKLILERGGFMAALYVDDYEAEDWEEVK